MMLVKEFDEKHKQNKFTGRYRNYLMPLSSNGTMCKGAIYFMVPQVILV